MTREAIDITCLSNDDDELAKGTPTILSVTITSPISPVQFRLFKGKNNQLSLLYIFVNTTVRYYMPDFKMQYEFTVFTVLRN